MRKLIDLPEEAVKKIKPMAKKDGVSVKKYIEMLIISHVLMNAYK